MELLWRLLCGPSPGNDARSNTNSRAVGYCRQVCHGTEYWSRKQAVVAREIACGITQPNAYAASSPPRIAFDFTDADFSFEQDGMRLGRRLSKLSAAFFAFALGAIVPAYAQNVVKLPSGGSLRLSTVSGATQIEVASQAGERKIVRVARDSNVAPTAKPSRLTLVGEVTGAAIVLVDTYPSIPGGMSYCRAGEESFLRVLSLGQGSITDALHIKLQSCRENIELASPGVEWLPESSKLRVRWIQGPFAREKPDQLEVRVGAN